MRWLVTGGCGFIGANLIADLRAAGGHQLRVLDDGSAGADSLRACGVDPGRLDLRVADVRDDRAVGEAARGIDVIAHLAGATGVVGSLADPRGDASANVLGTLNVLEAARRTGARVVFVSTTVPLVGDAPEVDERTLPAPRVPYGASKLAAEGYCQAYAASFGVASCVLRLTNVYGRGSGHKTGAVGRFLADGLAGRALTITGDGRQTRDFLHVADVVRALRLVAVHPAAPGGTFQIATGRPTAIIDLARDVQELLRRAGRPVPCLVNLPAQPAEVRATHASPAKAAALIGWQAEVGLSAGLARTFAELTREMAASRGFQTT